MPRDTNKTTKQVLTDALEAIRDPDNWITGSLHWDVHTGGHCYCALGAIAIGNGYTHEEIDAPTPSGVTENKFYDDEDPAVIALSETMIDLNMVDREELQWTDGAADLVWLGNDSAKHAHVVLAFEKAIEKL